MAVMNAALPIAQNDANVYAQKASQERAFWQTAGLTAFDATIQSSLMAQDHLNRIVEASHQGDINSRLQLEQFGYNWNLSAQDNLQQLQQLALQGDINATLALQKFGRDLGAQFGFAIGHQLFWRPGHGFPCRRIDQQIFLFDSEGQRGQFHSFSLARSGRRWEAAKERINPPA